MYYLSSLGIGEPINLKEKAPESQILSRWRNKLIEIIENNFKDYLK